MMTRMEASSSSAESLIDELVSGAQKSMVLRAFVELRLADHLRAGRQSASALASAVTADCNALARLLAGAAALGLCVADPDGTFGLSPAGELLFAADEGNAAGWTALLTSPWMIVPWANLADAVRTGTAVFPTVHAGVDFWAYVGAHPEQRNYSTRR